MIQTDVDVVNLALVKLGAQPVSSLTAPVTPIERRAALVYPHQRDNELSKRRWRFSLTRRLITPTMTADGYRWLLPTDPYCLRPLRQDWDCWSQEGRALISDGNQAISLLYVARVSEALFNPTFVEALAAKVAENLAELITQSNEKKDRAQADYREAIREARLINAYDTGAEEADDGSDSPFLLARYAGGCGAW